ncbi:MAG: HEPN domain-containing protein [Planctomycetaceae bacterium]|jgi:HEPN domain-containing protein|nr:HEPN domain-containing protein [Planctomycetaceae bacterium]
MNEHIKNQVKEWYFFADKDIAAASELLRREDLTNVVAFHCQQAVEKYIKAFMVANGMTIVKIHDLDKLNKLIKPIKDFQFNENILEHISQLYTEERYPIGLGLLPDGIPSQNDAEEFYRFAKEVETKIKDAIIF